MHPRILISLVLGAGIAGSGSGTNYQPGSEHHHIILGPAYVDSSAMANDTALEWTAPENGHASKLTWNEYIGGDPGASSMSYVLEVNGVAQCTIIFNCDVSGRVEQVCDVAYFSGDVLRIRKTADTCALNPSGGILVTTS